MAEVSGLVAFREEDTHVAVVMDDGKVNALSPAMLQELGEALDAAEKAGKPVVLAGRPGVFSAGFHLPTLRSGGTQTADLLRAGFTLSVRLLTFPLPVVAACSGHALAMASFVLLSVDHRIGAAGDFKIGANEVAIGMTMPLAAVEISRARLAPAHFDRAMNSAVIYDPDGAVTAGFLDEVVDADRLSAAAADRATALGALDLAAHAATKLRVRSSSLAAIKAGVEADEAFFAAFA